MSDNRSFGRGPHGGHGPVGWTRSDARLVEAVSEALSEDPRLDAREIEVSVEAGVVVLSGQAASAADAIVAAQIARRRAGAAEVRSTLTSPDVEPHPADAPPPPSS